MRTQEPRWLLQPSFDLFLLFHSNPPPSELESGAGVRNGAGVNAGVTGAAMTGAGVPVAGTSRFRIHASAPALRVISVASFQVGRLWWTMCSRSEGE